MGVDEYVEGGGGEYSEDKGIGDALSKVGVGLVAMMIACGGMFWNERRYVNRSQDLSWGKKTVNSIEASSIASDKDGELVHVSGEAEADAPLRDDLFGLEVDGLKLERTAEMYQWKEKVKEKNDKKVYEYERVWRSSPIDSDHFKRKFFRKHLRKTGSHYNPDEMLVEGETMVASDAELGVYSVPGFLLERLPTSEARDADRNFISNLPPNLQKRHPELTRFDGAQGICFPYEGHDRGCGDQVGDVRVSWSYEPEGPISLYAGLNGDTFEKFTDGALHGSLYRITPGEKSAKAMFKAAEKENWILLWGLRLGGLVAMILGISFLFAPIDFLASYVPFLGRLVDAGTNLIAAVLGFGLSVLVIAVGWITARPLIGMLLFLVAAAAIGGAIYLFVVADPGESESEPAR